MNVPHELPGTSRSAPGGRISTSPPPSPDEVFGGLPAGMCSWNASWKCRGAAALSKRYDEPAGTPSRVGLPGKVTLVKGASTG